MSKEIDGRVDSVVDVLKTLFFKLQEEPKRLYKEPWSDWFDGYTGTGTPHACVYCLWQEKNDLKPVYVGETVNLGKRLGDHDKLTGWTPPKWKYVSFVADKLLDDFQLRQLFECFCIEVFKPIDSYKREFRKQE